VAKGAEKERVIGACPLIVLGTRKRMIIYRLLSILLIMDLIAIVYSLTVKNASGACASFGFMAAILLLQISLIRCKCGCRPGLRLLVVFGHCCWTLNFIWPIPCCSGDARIARESYTKRRYKISFTISAQKGN
jgi:hypothetical protein